MSEKQNYDKILLASGIVLGLGVAAYGTLTFLGLNDKYKFTIGDRIDVVAEEAQEMILRANHQTDPKRAAQIIYDFVLRIDTLSLKLRMAVALGLMSDDAKAQCDMLIAKIKDEARGWRNYFLRGEGVVGKNNEPSAESL